MSRGSMDRLAIFLVFSIAAIAVSSLVWRAIPPQVVPEAAELQELEKRMADEALLHPRPVTAEPPGAAGFCRECHPYPPHAGSGIAAAMNNRHAQVLDCLLCHWSSAAGPRPSAAWQKGLPSERPGKEQGMLALYPPGKPLREDLARIRTAVTLRRKCFDRGPGCEECHRPGGLSAWARPGASPARTASVERLEDYFRLSPGSKWYFPQLR